jgi:uncharacterized cupin superfamily protein
VAQDKPGSAARKITKPFAVEDVPWEEWAEGQHFGGRVRRLGQFAGSSHVGVVIEELPPGKRSCPVHFHILEEEHLLMLEGQVTLRLGEKTYQLSAGDYVCFPAGQEAAHNLTNNTNAVCRYLVIGERNPNDVVVYPDSGKVLVCSTNELYRKSATMQYWDGEDTGSDEAKRGG